MLSGLGVNIIDISKILGHSNTRITQKVYEYLFINTDTAIINESDGYFNKLQKFTNKIQANKKTNGANRWFFNIFLAETVGFEPTCPGGQPHFECGSL